jgi:cytochrome c peroxidase
MAYELHVSCDMKLKARFRHKGLLLALLGCAAPACASDPETPGDDDSASTPSANLTANSRNQFSAPSAALYARNDGRVRGFPKVIDTGFSGYSHAETWDGRIFVTLASGWVASAFRPELITRNADSTVSFQGAFGTPVTLESDAQAPDVHHNWLSISQDPSVSGKNPYPSTSTGTPDANGTYETYRALVYHTSLRLKPNGDKDFFQMGMRKATFIVSNANTRNAQVVQAKFTSTFQRLVVPGDADLLCIEPSATVDGRLIVCQGSPENNGQQANLVYSWNPTPGTSANWSAPKSIANMYFDDRNANVAGVPFYVRYPIAERPLLDATGATYTSGQLALGAYPWLSHDGSELFYQASEEGVTAIRTATSVVGRWTGWAIRHIDGTINRNRHAVSIYPEKGERLFISSPGAFTTMWSPYKNVDDLKIPYSLRGPSYPIFGSNTKDYNEVGFDDYLDGNYILYLGMNESVSRDGVFQVTATNDTSGNFNNGTLVGARFPLEYNNQDMLVGRYGQGIYFAAGNYIDVSRANKWDTLAKGVSVDFWVKKMSGSGTVRLFALQGGVEVYLTNGDNLTAAITNDAGTRVQVDGPGIGSNWAHVACTYSPASKKLTLYLNGQRAAVASTAGFGPVRTSGTVHIGPESSTALMILDEVKVSNVERRPYEIAYSANVASNKGANAALMAEIPSYLSKLRFNVTGVDRFSSAAADLGRDLFSDVALSANQTTSCATCHISEKNFTDGRAIAKGNEPTDAGVRNTPILLNRLFSSFQGWSGVATTLDTQASVPIQAPHEMNLKMAALVSRLRANPTYRDRFSLAFGGQLPTSANVVTALGSFMARQFAPKNRVDDFLEGNRAALTAGEKRGFDLFQGKARCSGCHAGPNYTDESFRSNGLAVNDDVGRADVTGRDRDYKLFKVPSLRGLSLTAPYMHDGKKATLRDVVVAYNNGATAVPTRDTDILPLQLSAQEIRDLVAFLNAL